jgi:hypothetical protein
VVIVFTSTAPVGAKSQQVVSLNTFGTIRSTAMRKAEKRISVLSDKGLRNLRDLAMQRGRYRIVGLVDYEMDRRNDPIFIDWDEQDRRAASEERIENLRNER